MTEGVVRYGPARFVGETDDGQAAGGNFRRSDRTRCGGSRSTPDRVEGTRCTGQSEADD